MDEHDEPLASDQPSANELQEELDRLTAENEKLASKVRRRFAVRSIVSGVLVVITSLLLVASTVAVWGNRTVFDTDRFMAVVDPALDDPAFYDSLSRNISDQVIAALDLETRVRARLTQLDEFLGEALVEALDLRESVRTALSFVDRPSLADLTPSIVDPLEERVDERITGFITSDDFKQRLPALVRRAHEASLALVNGELADYPNVYIADDEVRLNLIPIIVEALEPVIETLRGYLPDIQLPTVVSERVTVARDDLAASLGVELPDDFGQLTIMSEDALSSIQEGAQRVNRATWLLVIVTAIFLILTLVVAPVRRRAIIWLSIGIAAALALSWWIVAQIRQSVLDEIAQPDSRAAVDALLDETAESFRTYVLVVLGVAVIAGLVAFVLAHLDWLSSGSRWMQQQASEPTPMNEWVTAHYDGLRVAGFIAAAVVFLLVGISIVPFLVVGGLLGVYLLALGAVRRDQSAAAIEPSET